MTDAINWHPNGTPGPYLIQPTDKDGVCIIADNLGGLVGAALPWPTEIDSGDYTRVETNARMFAEGPAMVAMLRMLIAECGVFHDADNDAIRAILSRIDGGAA